MSTLDIRSALLGPFLDAAREAGLREPSEVYASPVGTTATITYTPDLTAPEQAIVDTIARLSVGTTLVTPAEYDAIRDDIVVIRDLRQLGRNAFMALTAADRDRQLYDAQAATTTILLALLRE
jgi:hypothetical protein